MNRQRQASYPWLFRTHFFISAFTFGGGYVVIPMIRKYFVEQKQYFSEDELMDMAAIAQSSPGAIAVNLAVLSGQHTAGFPGAVLSCIASVLPPLLILSIVSCFYTFFRDNLYISHILKGMEAGVAALIVDLVIGMCQTVFHEKKPLMSLLIPAAFLASFSFHINVAVIILASSLFSFLICALSKLDKMRKTAGPEKEQTGGDTHVI